MNVSREVDSKLRAFADLVCKWNEVINLVSRDSIDHIYQRHIYDSLQLLKYLNADEKILDLGSGAGFPGLVLSISGVKNVKLVESDSRKCAFLRRASKLSDGKIDIVNSRIEKLENITVDVITARGFASLKKIFEYSKLFKAQKYLLLKGESVLGEIQEAQKEWLFEYHLHDSITCDEGKVIEIFKVSNKRQ